MTPAVSQAGWKSAPASADAECLQACSLRDAALRRSMRLVQERNRGVNRGVPSPKRSRIPSTLLTMTVSSSFKIMGRGCGQIGVIDSHDSSHASRLHAAPLRDFPGFSLFTKRYGSTTIIASVPGMRASCGGNHARASTRRAPAPSTLLHGPYRFSRYLVGFPSRI